MKNLINTVAIFVRKLPDDKFDLLAEKVDDVLTNKRVNRAARRRLSCNWTKCNKRKQVEQ